MTSQRDRRVTLALKWHYLDGFGVGDIQDRFESGGHGSYAKSTIRGYLNEEPKGEVLEQIEEEQATVRLQVAERAERRWQRAREAETQATQEVPIKRVVPQTRTANERQFVPAWELVRDANERPGWADERDVIIRFVDDEREVLAGDEYPVQTLDGSPKYTTEFVGLQRDAPDEGDRAALRREQATHMQQKGEVAGVFVDRHEIDATVEAEAQLSDDDRKLVLEAIRSLQEHESA
jgi:hypothetical protein